MKIGFVGGGTGGHFYPLIAVAEVLRETTPNAELYYFGPSPYSKELLAQHSITYVYTPAGKLRRYFSVQNFLDIFRSLFGIPVAIIKLYIIYPDVIFSKGSFTAVPILIAARLLRIPVVIHESDAKPGRANKIARSFARYIAISYDEAAQFFPAEKTALTGIPLRKEVTTINQDPFHLLGISNNLPLVYVTGGSLGAEKINNIIIRSLPELLPYARVFHQVGEANLKEVQLTAQSLLQDSPLQDNYYVVGSVPGPVVSQLLDAATLVVTRAGSTTLFEIASHGKPAIVIPIPEEISHDQRSNAYAFARDGGAVVIEEKNLTTHLLIEQIHSIIGNPSTYHTMAESMARSALTGAAEKIATLLITIAKEHE
jgi:UDP-N-acetylglucosamine--N-acetylmuramyl-(pentapeptide) pyrophosphoryl-undecaprenol N-acetylglucosamine transferase